MMFRRNRKSDIEYVREWIDDRVILDKDAETDTSGAVGDFWNWLNSIEFRRITPQKFTEYLDSEGITTRKDPHTGWVYVGIKLRP